MSAEFQRISRRDEKAFLIGQCKEKRKTIESERLENSSRKLKKLGKTNRPFRYDLNQIPCDYAVEVRNRFTGLDLIECLIK